MTTATYSFGLDGQPIDGAAFELLPAAGRVRLEQVVWALLFTDAPDTDGPVRGGGWAATFGLRGSRLWTLRRRVVTPALADDARQRAEESLGWLVTEGIAARVAVSAEVTARREITLQVTVVRGAARAWASLWEGTDG